MNVFTITNRMSAEDYFKTMLIGLYKKSIFIIITFFGIYLTVMSTIFSDFYDIGFSLSNLICGLFMLLAPFLISTIALLQFNSNPNYKKEIVYKFSESGYESQGATFKAEFLWEHIIKVKQIGNFLILYHSKQAGNFIDKRLLTKEQIEFIKREISSAHNSNQAKLL